MNDFADYVQPSFALMKRVICFFCAAGMFEASMLATNVTGIQQSLPEQITNQLRMTICLTNGGDHVRLHDPIMLSMQIQNKTTNTFYADFTALGWRGDQLQFIVKDSSKQFIFPINNGSRSGLFFVESHSIKVPPSNTNTLIYDLSFRYKFERSGTYHITASQVGFFDTPDNQVKMKIRNATIRDVAQVKIVSNQLDVTITNPPSEL